MTRPSTARCGTDSGYYRHRRQLKEPACDKCLRAHAAATAARSTGRRQPVRYCPCGSQTRTQHDKCYKCRNPGNSLIVREPAWVLQGGVWYDANRVSA
ncbi:MAG TPA: hypothetical protein VFC00_06990 [Micromonosporaceae bacterium]|nr:hypothetical protein [Micromonosporaceae bacterium]